MQPDFRFRIHRIGACFPDKYNVDIFVLPDGTVEGTVRSTVDTIGFIPVSFTIDRTCVYEMKGAFEGLDASDCDEPSINIGYGEAGAPLDIKSLHPLLLMNDPGASFLWHKCVEICDMCLP